MNVSSVKFSIKTESQNPTLSFKFVIYIAVLRSPLHPVHLRETNWSTQFIHTCAHTHYQQQQLNETDRRQMSKITQQHQRTFRFRPPSLTLCAEMTEKRTLHTTPDRYTPAQQNATQCLQIKRSFTLNFEMEWEEMKCKKGKGRENKI